MGLLYTYGSNKPLTPSGIAVTLNSLVTRIQFILDSRWGNIFITQSIYQQQTYNITNIGKHIIFTNNKTKLIKKQSEVACGPAYGKMDLHDVIA
jgi:hypothetical protein